MTFWAVCLLEVLTESVVISFLIPILAWRTDCKPHINLDYLLSLSLSLSHWLFCRHCLTIVFVLQSMHLVVILITGQGYLTWHQKLLTHWERISNLGLLTPITTSLHFWYFSPPNYIICGHHAVLHEKNMI